jgi:hypothetical protein
MLSEEDNAGVSPESASPTATGGVEGGGEEIQTLEQPSYSDTEAAALQELVQHSIGSLSSDNIEALPDPESIEKISNEKIKAMRRLTVDSAEVLPPFQEQLAETLIRAYSNFKTLFFPPPKERRYCELRGHECKHCGELVESTTQRKQRETAEKLKK